MSAFEQQYANQIKFVRINIDDAQAQPILRRYNVRGTPTIVLLDRQGHVVANAPGWSSDQAVAAALERLAAQP
ncbi:MAG: hypothetical protein HZB51_27580 [Chloroflexi bacterium]|nr:hypothetical protein [Chloroflexota bacterium]